MGAQYLIDSNAIIDYLSEKIPTAGLKFMDAVIDLGPNVSVITKIEILGFPTQTEEEQLLKDFINDSLIIHYPSLLLNRLYCSGDRSK
ncbi:MAG: hypothetical protein JNL02_08715 [Saprospiraceae bacterium]|nr:hypothetical protein [Saprospiraceae bacterium]